MRSPVVELVSVSKSFGGVRALDDVTLTLDEGEIHGLLGQNGSGKSTLIKILSGYYAPDHGILRIDGKPVELPILDPHAHGIAIIHQDLGLVDTMTVLENIGISDGYGRAGLAPLSWRALRKKATALLRSLSSEIDPDTQVGSLRPTDRSIVAIARALWLLEKHQAQRPVFVLDEPTAYLGPEESARLMAVMREVARHGAAVVFVSHKLREVLEVTDRCTILRDGKLVTTINSADTDAAELVRLQLGRDLDEFYPPMAPPPREEIALSVRDLTTDGVTATSFDLHAGEILGLTGLIGMGQDEVVEALGGARSRHGGDVHRAGGLPVGLSVRDALQAGIVLVPADRKGQGLWLQASSRENFTLPAMANVQLTPIRQADERRRTREALERVNVRPVAPEATTGSLSGGNQQKVLMAKWLAREPQVLLLHEPTQGVDAAARRDILGFVAEIAAQGAAVVLCSTDYEQIANVCHRVLTFRNGAVASVLHQPFEEAQVLLACQQADGSSSAAKPTSEKDGSQWTSA